MAFVVIDECSPGLFQHAHYSFTIWPSEGIRDANLSMTCTADPNNQALMFGFASLNITVGGKGQRTGPVTSRAIKTAPLPISIGMSPTSQHQQLFHHVIAMFSFL